MAERYKKVVKNKKDEAPKVYVRNESFIGQIVFLTIITYGLAVIRYDSRFSETLEDLFKNIVLLSFGISWMINGFINGLYKKWAYLIFSGCFWLIPQLLIYLADSGPKAYTLSLASYFLSQVSELMSSVPAMTTANFFGRESVVFGLVCILLSCALSFGIGVFVKFYLKISIGKDDSENKSDNVEVSDTDTEITEQ